MDKEDMYEVMKVTEEVERFSSKTDTSPPKKKRSKPHQADSIEKPKKPRSAYLLYYFDVHQVMQQEVPNLPQSEINKRISESWRRLSVAEKSFYLEKAKLEKEGSCSPSPSPSKELPGFRKILPRANYFVLAKGCSAGSQPGDSVPDVHRESLDGAGLSPVTVKVEYSPSGHSEVEQYPQAICVEEEAEETSATSLSETHGILPYTSFAVLPNTESSPSAVSTIKVHEDAPHIVTLIPTQNLLTQTSLASVTAVAPVMMMSSIEQSPKPSYNMPVKTYTRRGRGKCSNPRCSFMYVTRHKPPKCPDCGQYLGGKWIPVEKNAKTKSSNNANIGNQRKKPKVKNLVMKNPASKLMNEQVSSSGKHATPGGSSSTATDLAKDDRLSQDKVIVQKKPVRPILPAYYNKNNTLFKIVTVSNNERILSSNATSSAVPQQTLTGLKPSTLKQLGQTLQANNNKQVAPVSAEGSSPVSAVGRKMNVVSVVPFKQRTVTNFNLGLPTARGRGWCKNPSCDYMYKNRHKPALCPKCGLSLNQKDNKGIKTETLLDAYKPLTAAQKDLQRQSTLHLLQRSLQFAESEADLQETLSLIQELNNLQIILVQQSDVEQEDDVETETLFGSGWQHFFESNATHCSLCSYPLFKGGQMTVAPQVDCWLITETLMHRVSLQLKICLNIQCLALHSYTDLHSGLFNIGNKVLVTVDLFLKIRGGIKLGLTPAQSVETLLDHVPNHPIHTLTPEEIGQIQELLQSGYWAFECLTVRDYNDMICGICGVAPKIEISQRRNNLLSLKNVEFIWPEDSHSDEVMVDDFWLTMENEALEQAAFPSDTPIIRVDASIIAPFIPPLMRSPTIVNTEKNKQPTATEKSQGNPSVLVRLIHDGHLRLDKLEEHSEDELRTILHKCGADISPEMTKDELLVCLLSLYTQVHNGLSTGPQPSPQYTAGKLSKVCPHQVVCASKCLIRRETARDHIDLLLSSRYWPPVYVSDCAQQVALCADVQYPDLATQMWGRNQGCFCDPFEKPEIVSCAELQDQPHSADLEENHHVHPITRSVSRWLLHPPEETLSEDPPTVQHHSLSLCKDLEPYTKLLSEFKTNKGQAEETDSSGSTETSSEKSPVVFNNTAYYYLYNRLVDFLTSRDIVNRQIHQVLQSCQPGEVVIRDALYRLGVAKIDAEKEEEVTEDNSQAEEAVEAFGTSD